MTKTGKKGECFRHNNPKKHLVKSLKNQEEKMNENLKNKIIDAVKTETKEKLGTECIILWTDIKKNNNLIVPAISIREPFEQISPCIYLDQMLKDFEAGNISIQDMAGKITASYIKNRKKDVDILGLLNDKIILNCTVCQLINREKNKLMLDNVPYKKFQDLAVVYRCILSENNSVMASILINNEMLKKYEINTIQLDAMAQHNTEKKGFVTCPIASVLEDISKKISGDVVPGNFTNIPDDENLSMYILSNPSMIYGAAVMLYPNYIKQLADSLGDDLYIFPSSIHEIIAIPAKGLEPNSLKQIVQNVNINHVLAHEVLSDNVYKYQRGDEITIA